MPVVCADLGHGMPYQVLRQSVSSSSALPLRRLVLATALAVQRCRSAIRFRPASVKMLHLIITMAGDMAHAWST